MNKWPNFTMTAKGEVLLAKLIAGTKLTITRAVTGTGYADPETLRDQTAVTGEKQTVELRALTYTDQSKCVLHCRLGNSGLTEGYTAMQVGVYADDPDDGEILFCIAQAESGKGTDVPSESDTPGYAALWNLHIKFGQADGVDITVTAADTVTVVMMEDSLAKKVDVDLGNVDADAFAERTMDVMEDPLAEKADADLGNVMQDALAPKVMGLVFSTLGTGAAYTVTVPGITRLFAGLTITIIPHVASTVVGPTLDVNGLGAKPLRQRLSSGTGATTTGAHTAWLSAFKPVSVTFDGNLWMVNVPRASAAYLYGSVPIASGGTGATTAEAARNNLGITELIENLGNLHVWGRYASDPCAAYYTTLPNYTIQPGALAEFSKQGVHCEHGKVDLDEPTIYYWITSASFFTETYRDIYMKVNGSILYIPEDATIEDVWVNNDGVPIHQSIKFSSVRYYYGLAAETGTNVVSWDKDAYPDYGQQDGYWYAYKKQLGD